MGRFKTPGPGTYRCPSDFGYVDVIPKTSLKDKEDGSNYGYNLNDSIMSNSKRSASKQKAMKATSFSLYNIEEV